jgi:hypothetical protein
LCSSTSAPETANTAMIALTYMLKRQLSVWVSTPPSNSPIEAPLPAIAP